MKRLFDIDVEDELFEHLMSEQTCNFKELTVVDGKVVAIDGQTGEILDWPPDYGDVVNWEMSVKKGDK